MRAILVFWMLVGCRPDDVKDDTSGGEGEGEGEGETADSGETGTGEETIVGSWLSEGENVSILLQGYGFTSITADFAADGTYAVAASTSTRTFDFTGTYTADVSTTPHTISLTQTAPTADTAVGIWDVEGTTLTYEVLAASAEGCTAPTVEAGFGSTDCPSGDYEVNFNVQTFVAQ